MLCPLFYFSKHFVVLREKRKYEQNVKVRESQIIFSKKY